MPPTEPLDLEPIKARERCNDRWVEDVPDLIAEVERLRARLASVVQINDALLEDVADMRAAKEHP